MRAAKTPTGSLVILACGSIVEGEPHDTEEYRLTAQSLGYGNDILAMCQDHDPLHVALCRWLGLEISFAMSIAAGDVAGNAVKELAVLEEAAVIAVQRFAKRSGAKIPT
jgi:hypothetical protein